MKSTLRVYHRKSKDTVMQRIARIVRLSKQPSRPAPEKSTGNPVRKAQSRYPPQG